jgi:hypothetical protein
MRRLLSVMMLSVFLLVFCGAPPETAETETTPGKEQDVSNVAYQTLTEAELMQFMKVLPMVKEEVENSGKEFESDAKDFESAISDFARLNTEVVGLNAKLTAAGMPWEKFWPAMAKTWMAIVSVMVHEEMGEMESSLKEMEAQMNDPKIPEAQKEMMKNAVNAMKQVKTIYEKVPQGNRDLVKKHWDKLSELMEIED